MAKFTKLPPQTIFDITRTVRFSNQKSFSTEERASFFPPEWFPQSGVLLTWPHQHTHWADILAEVEKCYLSMAYEIANTEKLLVVSPEPDYLKKLFKEKLPQRIIDNIQILQASSNDTWARDHGFITVYTDSQYELLDFQFNGWGNKYPAQLDNAINARIAESGMLKGEYKNCLDFVLEGGSIESDGRGTILTTESCLLTPTRNNQMSRLDIEDYLKKKLHIQRILWLKNGHLAGDDTDGHIDTLARFLPNDQIAYVKCTDINDDHYECLNEMEKELKQMKTPEGTSYQLVPLPMADPIVYDGERLPATYANFLIINNKILMPTYNQPQNDELAKKVLQTAMPKYEVIGIDCQVLIKQYGSLHCCTMQFPKGVML